MCRPKVIGIRLTGSLSGWSSPKDVILEVARQLTVEGGTEQSWNTTAQELTHFRNRQSNDLQYGAESAQRRRCLYDSNMADYLRSTGRADIADAADEVANDLRPDDGKLRPARRNQLE